VGFEVLPAIDLQGGRVARMSRGDPSTLERLDVDPLELARSWAAAGVRWVHVVDLDAALGGHTANLQLLRDVGALGLRVEAGGGLSEDGVAAALEYGASRAVLGARALLAPGTVEHALATYGDRVAIGLDAQGGRVVPRGSGASGPTVEEALARLAAARPALIVYTDVERDGTLSGPDLDGLSRVVEATGVPVLASGGVRSAADVAALAARHPALAGVIVGRALQDGRLSIDEALAAARVD
jgi:phosphoribosylformimino-5-aminoimidazole carboxamide ribotide isomerase